MFTLRKEGDQSHNMQDREDCAGFAGAEPMHRKTCHGEVYHLHRPRCLSKYDRHYGRGVEPTVGATRKRNSAKIRKACQHARSAEFAAGFHGRGLHGMDDFFKMLAGQSFLYVDADDATGDVALPEEHGYGDDRNAVDIIAAVDRISQPAGILNFGLPGFKTWRIFPAKRGEPPLQLYHRMVGEGHEASSRRANGEGEPGAECKPD